jgi:hypothetical protein
MQELNNKDVFLFFFEKKTIFIKRTIISLLYRISFLFVIYITVLIIDSIIFVCVKPDQIDEMQYDSQNRKCFTFRTLSLVV